MCLVYDKINRCQPTGAYCIHHTKCDKKGCINERYDLISIIFHLYCSCYVMCSLVTFYDLYDLLFLSLIYCDVFPFEIYTRQPNSVFCEIHRSNLKCSGARSNCGGKGEKYVTILSFYCSQYSYNLKLNKVQSIR
jgi:hypothetical protein